MPCANDQFTIIPVSVATQLHPWESGFGGGGNDDFIYKRVPPLSYTNRDGVRLMNNHVINGNMAFLFELATGGAATMPAELVIGISKTYPVPAPSE